MCKSNMRFQCGVYLSETLIARLIFNWCLVESSVFLSLAEVAGSFAKNNFEPLQFDLSPDSLRTLANLWPRPR